jgi:hypothetical protein
MNWIVEAFYALLQVFSITFIAGALGPGTAWTTVDVITEDQTTLREYTDPTTGGTSNINYPCRWFSGEDKIILPGDTTISEIKYPSHIMGSDDQPAQIQFSLWSWMTVSTVFMYEQDEKCKVCGVGDSCPGKDGDDGDPYRYLSVELAGSMRAFVNDGEDVYSATANSDGNLEYVRDKGPFSEGCVKPDIAAGRCDKYIDQKAALGTCIAFDFIALAGCLASIFFTYKAEPKLFFASLASAVTCLSCLIAFSTWTGSIQNSDEGLEGMVEENWRKIVEIYGGAGDYKIKDPKVGPGVIYNIVIMVIQGFLAVMYFIGSRKD